MYRKELNMYGVTIYDGAFLHITIQQSVFDDNSLFIKDQTHKMDHYSYNFLNEKFDRYKKISERYMGKN